MDKKEQPITLQKVTMKGSTDHYLCIHSAAKQAAEAGMNTRFSTGFEEGLTQINASPGKKSGVKKQQKASVRIGRLKAKYPSAHKYNYIEVMAGDSDM